ncbi:hypothetical protein AMS68_003821 [Peltaster fructicola]|uniref:Uncharacterized protein n=1 Tax=Peltaster fructicola TaxID=286661 RepID=A0A6H0XU96_9PEZI|nr:hypothetical protein AMS68_003821 [Peltaster fructicola]
MSRQSRIDFVEILGEEAFETWIASLRPHASSPDIFAAQDSDGRYTHPIHEQSQIAALVPSAKVLCPTDRVTDASWKAWTELKGAVKGYPETLMMHSVKFRALSDALRNCFFRFVNNDLVPNYSELVILCDYTTTYAITHFFLVVIGIEFVERSKLADYSSGKVRVALLSSRNLNIKLRATKVVCMDVVPSPVLYKIVEAVPTACIEVFIFSMHSHDLRLAHRYYHNKPTNGGRIVCDWYPRNFMNAFQCIGTAAAVKHPGKRNTFPHKCELCSPSDVD